MLPKLGFSVVIFCYLFYHMRICILSYISSPAIARSFLKFALLCLAVSPVLGTVPAPDEDDKAAVKIIRFDDLAPADARLTTCWDAVGIDSRQRVYVAFSDQSDLHPNDTLLFRYDTRNGARKLLGTLRQISRDDNNLLAGETIAKIHVPFREHAGKFYFSSHDYHSYNGEAELDKHRGGHFYSYDLQTGKFEDLSKTEPGGISVPHQGIIGLTVLERQKSLAGLTFPHGDILIYDLEKPRSTLHPGIAEHRHAGKPTRQIFATEQGRVFFTYYDRRPSPLYVFDLHTGKTQKTRFNLHFGMLYGALRTRDGSTIYLVDLFGNLYAFHTADERLEDLGSLLPPEQSAAGLRVENCYALVLSPDEQKLYTFPSRLSEAPALRLYEFNLKTHQRRQIADFTVILNGSSKGTQADRNGRITGSGVYDSEGRMYFGYHESGDTGRNGALLQITLPGVE